MPPTLLSDLVTLFRLESLATDSPLDADYYDAVADDLEDRLCREGG